MSRKKRAYTIIAAAVFAALALATVAHADPSDDANYREQLAQYGIAVDANAIAWGHRICNYVSNGHPPASRGARTDRKLTATHPEAMSKGVAVTPICAMPRKSCWSLGVMGTAGSAVAVGASISAAETAVRVGVTIDQRRPLDLLQP